MLNLQKLTAGVVTVSNPKQLVTIRVSTGNTSGPDSKRTPTYATPCSFMGSIAGNTLSVLTLGAGTLQIGQAVADESNVVAPNTEIVGLITGTGGPGTYLVNVEQEVPNELMQTTFLCFAQIQPMTWRDIQMVDGLNLQGTRNKIYITGKIDGLIRPDNKGGDLIAFPNGDVYLVGQVLEGFVTAGWCSVAATLQNGS